jgi:hypothetical protein
MELLVTEAPPGVKGNTASGGAQLEGRGADIRKHGHGAAKSRETVGLLPMCGWHTSSAHPTALLPDRLPSPPTAPTPEAGPTPQPTTPAAPSGHLCTLLNPAPRPSPGPPPFTPGGTKTATLETGATINVPLFIESGEVIKIDTRTDTYIGRSKEA